MRDEELARILKSDNEQILPSSGFVASVMEAVRAEALAPPPIPFPWKRAIPGLAAACVALVSLIVVFVTQLGRTGAQQASTVTWWPQVVHAFQIAQSTGIGWVLAALLVALLSVWLPFRLVGRRT